MNKSGLALMGLAAAAGLAFAVSASEQAAPQADKAKKQHGKRDRMNYEEVFKKWDADADGKVTKDEYLAAGQERAKTAGREAPKKEAAEKRFTAMDANSDGVVTKEEVKAGFEKRMKERGKSGKDKGGDSAPACDEVKK